MRTRKGIDTNDVILVVGLLILVLLMTWMLLSVLTEGTERASETENTECEKQQKKEDCTALKTENWIGEKKNKCFWDDQTGTCGAMVR